MINLTEQIFEMREKIPDMEDLLDVAGVAGVCEILLEGFRKKDPEAKAGITNEQLVEIYEYLIKAFDQALLLAVYSSLLEEKGGFTSSYDFSQLEEDYDEI